jgi:AcrR family transcriptional regulator
VSVLSKRTRDDPRRAETERAFLRATEELLEEGASFADLNVSRIATRAQRTRTAFYAHFDDRRDLLVRLIETLVHDLDRATAAFWSGPADRPEIEAALAGLLATYREHRSLVRAVVEAAGYDDEIAGFWNRGAVGRFLAAAEDRLRRDGRADEEARATAHALVWMTERAIHQHVLAVDGLSDEAVLSALAGIWERTLRP